jgi:hypothetical protein
MNRTLFLFLLALTSSVTASLCAQDAGRAAAQADQQLPPSAVVTKSVQAVGYEVGGGSTKLDLKGTDLMAQATGQAKVEIKSNAGRTSIDVEAKGLQLPSTLGAEFLTYVLWVVTPEGRTGNTGEILLDKN